jgi:serine/threonine protein kinase
MSNEELYPAIDSLGLGATVRGFVPGQVLFDRFLLRRVLGWGDLGVVWLAFDDLLQKEVALKFLPELVRLDAVSVEELQWEIGRYRDLEHPHIVRLHELVGDAAASAVLMEFIPGHSLSKWCAHQPGGVFEVEQIHAWIAQFLDALIYAHGKDELFHRDLKPSNLLVDEADQLKITDFGTARSIRNSVSRVDTRGTKDGSLVYTSKQQLMAADPSAQDDIYSFGATVYELLTSRPPFLIENGDLLKQIWKEVPPSMAERRRALGIVGADLPLDWEQVIASCLAKEPAERPQSITEVAERLGLRAAPIAFTKAEQTPSLPAVEPPVVEAKQLPTVEIPPSQALSPDPIEVPAANTVPPVIELPPIQSMPAPVVETAPTQTPSPVGMEIPPKTPPIKTSRPRTIELPTIQPEPRRLSLKDQLIVFSLILLFVLDGLGYYFIFVKPDADKERVAEMAQLEATEKAAAADAEKLKAEQAKLDEEKAALEKAKDDAEARAQAAEQAARQAIAEATKANQSEQAVLQRTAEAIAPVPGKPWTNSLGVKFVPAGTDNILFSVWDVRVKDYAAFVADTKHEWPKPKFTQTDNDPAVEVSWDDARAFCDWLTKKEHEEGRLTAQQLYRLPTDAEWSKAVGLMENGGGLPKENDGDIKNVYPWGNQWPPPPAAGNYAESLTNDGFSKTSPVGTFTPNSFGLYDMGGNVWQWCDDKYDYAHDWRVLRGASWVDRVPDSLLSSSRSGNAPDARDDGSGFRVVVEVAP